jgi:hypothetical protein
MAPSRPRRLFATDQNFPEPILDAVKPFIAWAELVPLRRIREELTDVDDWQVMLELYKDDRPWDGLITNDDKLLALPKEMVVLTQTQLTLVVVKGHGHNPIRATGLLMAHLEHICHQTDPKQSQIWLLSTSQKAPERPQDRLVKIAEAKNRPLPDLVREHQVAASELARKRGE